MITKVKRTRCAQPYKLPAPKNLGLQAALDLMRTGGALAELHLPSSEGGKAWYIAPAGGRITAVTAARILERSDVQPSGDGLFGTSQTFRIKPR